MSGVTSAPPWAELDQFVEGYEKHLLQHGRASISEHLPQPEHEYYLPVLRELVRVDLEYHWDRGQRKLVEEYLAALPALNQDTVGLREIAFEEFRLRHRAGESPAKSEYSERFGIDTQNWPEFDPVATQKRDLDLSQTTTNGRSISPFKGEHRPAPPSPNGSGGSHSTLRHPRHSPTVRDARTASGPELAVAAYLGKCSNKSSTVDVERALAGVAECQAFADLLVDLHRSDPDIACRLARSVAALPREGSRFLGFHLIQELGSGAFGKVFLAQQGELADRRVALKIATDLFGESSTLARLQHTNIVPVYSLHRGPPLEAICMPYFGATTLAHVLEELRRLPEIPRSGKWLVQLLRERELVISTAPGRNTEALQRMEQQSYVNAVLWLVSRLAEGLAHAHERGIIHQDLKPANVLLSDEGQPMLLDFNLSRDTQVRSSATGAYVGGTLPYMAPEQLESFRTGTRAVDPRSDVYSLGLILFELLAGRSPFEIPPGPVSSVLGQILASRREPLPDPRRWNPAVTRAVDAIVRRCLEADPQARYRSARDLQQDIERHLANLPLQYARESSLGEQVTKWLRRHPRLTSLNAVGVIASLIILVVPAAYYVHATKLGRSEAIEARGRLEQELRTTRFLLSTPVPTAPDLIDGMTRAERALGHYGVLNNPLWTSEPVVSLLNSDDRRALQEDVSELLLLLARGERARAETLGSSGRREERLERALRLNELAEGRGAGEKSRRAILVQRSLLLESLGRVEEASDARHKADSIPTQCAREYCLLGMERLAQSQFRLALPLLQQARNLDSQDASVCYALGLCYLGLGRSDRALAALDMSCTLWPRFGGSYYHRARAHWELKQYREAVDDLDQAIRLQPRSLTAFLDRARAKSALGDNTGALADLTYVLESGSAPTRAYFMRADVRENSGDQEGARQDRAEGMRREPTDDLSCVARGLAHIGDSPLEALADFDAALKLNPKCQAALEEKARVLAERLDRTEEAIAVLDEAITLYPDSILARATRGVLRARLGLRELAIDDATEALRLDDEPASLYQVAGIYALTSRQRTEDRREALRLLAESLRAGYGLDLVHADSNLDPIRSLTEFQDLIKAAQVLGETGAQKTPKRGPVQVVQP